MAKMFTFKINEDIDLIFKEKCLVISQKNNEGKDISIGWDWIRKKMAEN